MNDFNDLIDELTNDGQMVYRLSLLYEERSREVYDEYSQETAIHLSDDLTHKSRLLLERATELKFPCAVCKLACIELWEGSRARGVSLAEELLRSENLVECDPGLAAELARKLNAYGVANKRSDLIVALMRYAAKEGEVRGRYFLSEYYLRDCTPPDYFQAAIYAASHVKDGSCCYNSYNEAYAKCSLQQQKELGRISSLLSMKHCDEYSSEGYCLRCFGRDRCPCEGISAICLKKAIPDIILPTNPHRWIKLQRQSK